MTERPLPPPKRERSGSNAATMMAMAMLLTCAGCLFFLVVIVNPFAIGILVIGLVFVPMSLMHYLVWGRLMQQHNLHEQQQIDLEQTASQQPPLQRNSIDES